MAFRKTKSEVLALTANMTSPSLRTFRGSVYLRDGNDTTTEIEIYRASNMEEAGILSSMNQANKYRAWIAVQDKARRLSERTGFTLEQCHEELIAEEGDFDNALINLRGIVKEAQGETLDAIAEAVPVPRRIRQFYFYDAEDRAAIVEEDHAEALGLNAAFNSSFHRLAANWGAMDMLSREMALDKAHDDALAIDAAEYANHYTYVNVWWSSVILKTDGRRVWRWSSNLSVWFPQDSDPAVLANIVETNNGSYCDAPDKGVYLVEQGEDFATFGNVKL